MKALTVRQPWAWAIIHAGKDIENRSWTTSYRGPLSIHASGREPDSDELATFFTVYEQATRQIINDFDEMVACAQYVRARLVYGSIIGAVGLVDVVRDSNSPWAEDGAYHWRLRNPREISAVRLRGQQGLYDVPCPSCGGKVYGCEVCWSPDRYTVRSTALHIAALDAAGEKRTK